MSDNYVNPLPGVPNVESPFFPELFDEGDPHFRIAKSLNEQGFAIFEFPDADVDSLAEQVIADLGPRYPWDAWRSGATELRTQDAWVFSAAVKRIAANSNIIALLSKLYGRRAFPFQTLNFPVGTEQHFHTDSVHFSCRPERFMCGVWLALEDVGLDQGPLIYYPGSHKWPIFTHEHIGHTFDPAVGGHQRVFEPMWQRLVEINGVKPERLEIKKGHALIWAANLLHGGDAQRDRKRTRWSQVTHYYFDNCVYYTPLHSNEPAGLVAHRTPSSIIDNFIVQGRYNGRIIDLHAGLSASSGLAKTEAARYLDRYPDVKAAGTDPREHYEKFGRQEGRIWDTPAALRGP